MCEVHCPISLKEHYVRLLKKANSLYKVMLSHLSDDVDEALAITLAIFPEVSKELIEQEIEDESISLETSYKHMSYAMIIQETLVK